MEAGRSSGLLRRSLALQVTIIPKIQMNQRFTPTTSFHSQFLGHE